MDSTDNKLALIHVMACRRTNADQVRRIFVALGEDELML